MSALSIVICDGCGRRVDERSDHANWLFIRGEISCYHGGGTGIRDGFQNSNYDFCSTDCLFEMIKKRRAKEAAVELKG